MAGDRLRVDMGYGWAYSASECLCVPTLRLILCCHHIRELFAIGLRSRCPGYERFSDLLTSTLKSRPTQGAETSWQVLRSFVCCEWKEPQLSVHRAFFPLGLRSAFWVRTDRTALICSITGPVKSCVNLISWFPAAPLWLMVRSTSVCQTQKAGSCSVCPLCQRYSLQ